MPYTDEQMQALEALHAGQPLSDNHMRVLGSLSPNDIPAAPAPATPAPVDEPNPEDTRPYFKRTMSPGTMALYAGGGLAQWALRSVNWMADTAVHPIQRWQTVKDFWGMGDGSPPPPIKVRQELLQKQLKDKFDYAFNVVGAGTPETQLDRDVVAGFRNIIPSIASGGMALLPSTPAMVSAAGQMLGPMANSLVRRTTGSSGAGTAVELAMAGVVPMSTDLYANKLARAAISEQAKEFLKNADSDTLRGLNGIADNINDMLKARYSNAGPNAPQVTIEDVVQGSGELKRILMAGGERSGINVIDEWLPYLDKATEAFPMYQRANPAQAVPPRLMSQITGSFQDYLSSVGPAGTEFSSGLANQQEAFARNVLAKFKDQFPDVPAEDAVDLWKSFNTSLHQDSIEAWKKVNFKPVFNSSDYTDEALKLFDEASGAESSLPNWLNNMPDNPDLTWVQNKRSALLETERAASPLVDGSRARGYWAGEVRRRILDPMIDSLPARSEKSYADARAATLTWKRLTDPSTPGGEVASVLGRILGGAEERLPPTILRSKENMQRAVEMLGQTPEGMQALDSIVQRELFGIRDIAGIENAGSVGADVATAVGNLQGDKIARIGTRSADQVRAQIARSQGALKVLYGEDKINAFIEFTDYMDQLARSRAIRPDVSTGFAQKQPNMLARLASTIHQAEPIAVTTEAIGKLLEGVQNDATHVLMMQEAWSDTGLMARLLRTPAPEAVPAYVMQWKQLAARSAVRAAGMAAEGGMSETQRQNALIDEAIASLSQSLHVPPERVPESLVVQYVRGKLGK